MENITPFDRIFQSCGWIWHIRRADMDKLWEAMTERQENEDRLPYWNEVWPSSLALAGWLAEMQDDIRGKNCLDMGCGLGFTALMGCRLGAHVTGIDYEAEALEYARINEKLNDLSGVRWKVMDWRMPTLPPASFDRIWAGDIMYEKEFAIPIAAFLSGMLRPGGRAWIAEPGRDIFHHLLDILPEKHLSSRRICSLPVMPLTPQENSVMITIWEIAKG
jgi:predicted nicotinamide N-methyase